MDNDPLPAMLFPLPSGTLLRQARAEAPRGKVWTWLQALPQTIQQCLSRWQIEWTGESLKQGYFGYVLPCRCKDGEVYRRPMISINSRPVRTWGSGGDIGVTPPFVKNCTLRPEFTRGIGVISGSTGLTLDKSSIRSRLPRRPRYRSSGAVVTSASRLSRSVQHVPPSRHLANNASPLVILACPA